MAAPPKKGLDLIVGLVATASLVFAVGAISYTFAGRFSDVITVTAHVAQAGDALQPGDPVSYRDVIIGRVTEAAGQPGGGAVLRLRVARDQAKVIPGNVTAIAIPATLFGAFLVRLVPPQEGTAAGRLVDGDPIAADKSPSALGLQSALSDVYDLLSAVHPAELDAALSALADAFRGQGDNVGELLEKANKLLRDIAPTIPTLEQTIRDLATVSEQVARNAPSLLQSVSNLIDVSQTFVDSRATIQQLISLGIPTLARTEKALRDHGDQIVTIVVNQRKVLGAFAEHPHALAQLVDGGKTLADLFALVFTGGQAKLTLLLTGANLAALGPLLLGQKGEVLKGITDPPTYTNAQCPQYPGLSGANCGSSITTAGETYTVLSSGSGTGGTVGPTGSSAERQAVSAYAQAATKNPIDPTIAQLIAGPVLRGRVTVVG